VLFLACITVKNCLPMSLPLERGIQQLTVEEFTAVRERSGDGGLNGIAYLPERDTFLLTGKMYPYVFESSLIPVPMAP
jgi:Glutamine cyclotransferase